MIVSTQAEAEIQASPEQVFDAANDLDHIADAFVGYGPIPAVTRAEVVGGGPLALGTTRKVYTSDGNAVDEEMLVFDHGKAFAYKLTGIALPFSLLVRFARADWRLTPASGATHVQWNYAFTLTSPLAWPLAYPLLTLVFKRWMLGCLREIGAIAEGRKP
jgi:hypothetical protein